MPLRELTSMIEGLKNRIEQHGVVLRQNEALTRYALIDPLPLSLSKGAQDQRPTGVPRSTSTKLV